MDKGMLVSRILEGHAEAMPALGSVTKTRFAYDSLLKVVDEGEYFLGIAGLRGIGKTVLLLQLARASGGVYFSADDKFLRGTGIYDAVAALSDAGHKRVFIDEIHSKADWDADLKAVYEENLARVAFSGSSAIQIRDLKADLSRRVVLEHLKPASFREWLSIKKGVDLPLLDLEKIARNKAGLARDFGFANKFVHEYYASGGVLYNAKAYFFKTVLSTIETIATKDFAAVKAVEEDTVENFFKLLFAIASAKPMELSYSSIGDALEKNKVWVMRFLADVEKTGVITRVYPCGDGLKPFRKEAKYYLPFPYRHALCTSLGKTPDIGALREEFFANHVGCCYLKTSGAPTADFKAGGKTFEIGGKNKGAKQGADYVVTDGLDTTGNKIPLFAFGLTY